MSDIATRLLYALFLTAKWSLAPVAVGVAAMVTDEMGRVLLVRHRYSPHWRLPGGGIDPAEMPVNAIRREMEEEVGLKGGSITLVSHHARKVLWIGHVVVLYRIDGADIAFHPSLELREILWADPAAPPVDVDRFARHRLAEMTGTTTYKNW